MFRNFIVFLLTLCSLTVFAQKWYFGQNAGLNFSTATPTALSGPINTGEGCAIVYNNAGQVLFSTDGSTVYGANNTALPNGTGLMGNASATQSALLVPVPGTNCNKYFLFTVDAAEHSLSNGFRYSVIDKTLNSGMGDIAAGQKNLIPPSMANIRVTEKLTGVSDGTGGFWVIVHGFEPSTNANPGSASPGYKFYAFHITGATLAAPVISTVGSLHNMNAVINQYRNSQGQMKVSHDGKMLALAVHLSRFAEIFDFSVTTGNLTNARRINFPQQNECQVYGIEFSSNNNYLYVSTTYDFPNQARVYQFALSAAYFGTFSGGVKTYATAPINDPLYVKQISPNNYSCEFGALQLGPDNNIYVASMLGNSPGTCNNAIDMISNANSTGATFNQNYVQLTPGLCRRGLPTVLQGNFVCGNKNNTCCPDLENLISNFDFSVNKPSLGFTSQYTYDGGPYTSSSLLPGEFGITNSAGATALCASWPPVKDHSTCPTNGNGNFLVVNGSTGQATPKKLIWSQTINNVPGGVEHKFCAQFKNLPVCCFDVKPKVDIKFIATGLSGADLLNQVINVTSAANCGWIELKQVITLPATGNLTIQIWLDESAAGDGNDLVIDDIALVRLPPISVASTFFSVSLPTPQGGNNYGFTFNSPPLPAGCYCAWSVCELDPVTDQCKPGTQVYNDQSWWSLPNYCGSFNFAGYDGSTGTLGSTSSPGVFDITKTYRITRGAWCDCKGWAATSYDLFEKNKSFVLIDSKTKKVVQTIQR